MKLLLLIASFLLPAVAMGQNDTKPPKLRIEPSFLNTKYELGDKTTPAKEVGLHLKKYEPDAYIKWKAADRADNSTLIFMLLGTVGMLVGIAADEPEVQLAGYGAAVVGYSISLGAGISGKSRRQKAIDLYNTKFGY